MRIGFDAKRAAVNLSGLGNYSRTLIKNLTFAFPGDSYVFYSPVGPKAATGWKGPSIQLPPALWENFGALWRSFGISDQLVKDQLDLYHGLSGELPFVKPGKIKFVLTVHDLIFLRFPQYYKVVDRALYLFKLRHALKVADQVIAISEQTKSDLEGYMNYPASKVKVVYQACDSSFGRIYSLGEHQRVKQLYALPSNYILCVATLEERKNQLLILQALVILKERSGGERSKLPVVLVGKKTNYWDLLQEFMIENQLESQIHYHAYVPQSDLPLVYQNAFLFVYPSRFEGFGIPIIEALNSSLPVVSSTGSCFSEAGGPDSLYTDPDDPHALATHIQTVYENASKREKMVLRGRSFAQNFTPGKLSAQLMEIYRFTAGI